MYHFKHYYDHETDGLSETQLQHLELVDRALSKPELRHLTSRQLERMTDESIINLLSGAPSKQPRPPRDPKPVQTAPAKPARWVNPYPVARYRAQVWCDGRPVFLGYFLNEVTRDEVVTMAKGMRDIGLPLDAIREAVQRMTR